MRKKKDPQLRLQFQASTLKITNEYYRRYEAISTIFDETPAVLTAVHEDLKKALESENKVNTKKGRPCSYTSETVVRILVCMFMEGMALREVVVRIDDSHFLRQFTRIHDDPMMDYTTLCKFKNAIQPKTWKKINRVLAKSAVEAGLITGEKLRLDTTAVETNIHWPTDSGLLWDTYRVLGRLIATAREVDPEAVGCGRLQTKRAKKLHGWINRKAGKKKETSNAVKARYEALMGLVEAIVEWATNVADGLEEGLGRNAYDLVGAAHAEALIWELRHFVGLGKRVVDQATRRVLRGEQVPAEQKLYSIFEPHTELLKRGKAGKPIEFGHMIVLHQEENKFITDYEAFEKKPIEHELVAPAVESHEKLFGKPPSELTADKGFYGSMALIHELEDEIEVVSIGKRGHKTDEEAAREASAPFKMAQAFRAGIEGSISVLKRALRMFRCFNKGWRHYAATVGAIVFAHNLLVLSRLVG